MRHLASRILLTSLLVLSPATAMADAVVSHWNACFETGDFFLPGADGGLLLGTFEHEPGDLRIDDVNGDTWMHISGGDAQLIVLAADGRVLVGEGSFAIHATALAPADPCGFWLIDDTAKINVTGHVTDTATGAGSVLEVQAILRRGALVHLKLLEL